MDTAKRTAPAGPSRQHRRSSSSRWCRWDDPYCCGSGRWRSSSHGGNPSPTPSGAPRAWPSP
eukprot:15121463-Alexandrium_andersonii.AAC.1